MSTAPQPERSKKRVREDEQDHKQPASPPTLPSDPTTQSTTSTPDSIAAFLALHSPPPKLARTAHASVTRTAPTSLWPALPAELVPLVCAHLASWRDLLRLCRVHRRFDACVRSPTTAPACWQNVSTIRVRFGAPASGGGGLVLNDRPLLCAGGGGEEARRRRVLFTALRFVPRLVWTGDADASAPLLDALPTYVGLRHLAALQLHTQPPPAAATTAAATAAAATRLAPCIDFSQGAFRTLVSLQLDHTHRAVARHAGGVQPLRLRHLAAPTDFVEALLASAAFEACALAGALEYVHCHGATHWLAWGHALLPALKHVYAGERPAVRSDSRLVSHKRPRFSGSGGGGGGGGDECRLVSYALRQSDDWLHSRLAFPALASLVLHGKDLFTLDVLHSLHALPCLQQLTISRRAAWSTWQQDVGLPPASGWLPSLARLVYLDVQCVQSVDAAWLHDLLFQRAPTADADTETDGAEDSGMARARARLVHLALQLPAGVAEAEVRRGWRLGGDEWPALRSCCLRWSVPLGGVEAVAQARDAETTALVVGAERACERRRFVAQRVDRQWLDSAGVER